MALLLEVRADVTRTLRKARAADGSRRCRCGERLTRGASVMIGKVSLSMRSAPRSYNLHWIACSSYVRARRCMIASRSSVKAFFSS